MTKDTEDRLKFKEAAMKCEYQYLVNGQREHSSASSLSNLFIGIPLYSAFIWALYTYWDKIHIFFKIVGVLFAIGSVFYIILIVLSKELMILLLHNVISFIFDAIFVVILLPRKMFGHSTAFIPSEKDVKHTYSDITYTEQTSFKNMTLY